MHVGLRDTMYREHKCAVDELMARITELTAADDERYHPVRRVDDDDDVDDDDHCYSGEAAPLADDSWIFGDIP